MAGAAQVPLFVEELKDQAPVAAILVHRGAAEAGGMQPRSGSAVCQVGADVVVFGGADTSGHTFSDTWAFNIAKRAWRRVGAGDSSSSEAPPPLCGATLTPLPAATRGATATATEATGGGLAAHPEKGARFSGLEPVAVLLGGLQGSGHAPSSAVFVLCRQARRAAGDGVVEGDEAESAYVWRLVAPSSDVAPAAQPRSSHVAAPLALRTGPAGQLRVFVLVHGGSHPEAGAFADTHALDMTVAERPRWVPLAEVSACLAPSRPRPRAAREAPRRQLHASAVVWLRRAPLDDVFDALAAGQVVEAWRRAQPGSTPDPESGDDSEVPVLVVHGGAGWEDGEVFGDAHLLRLDTLEWSAPVGGPGLRYAHAMWPAAPSSSTVCLWGGLDPGEGLPAAVHWLDVATLEWGEAEALSPHAPAPRLGPACAPHPLLLFRAADVGAPGLKGRMLAHLVGGACPDGLLQDVVQIVGRRVAS